MCLAPGMLCPEGAVGLSPGFQPWEPTPKRRALKGRQIERTNHTNAGCRCNMSIARSSRPFRAKRFIDWFPGLKPWAESSSPFGAGLWAIWPTLNTYQGLPWVSQQNVLCPEGDRSLAADRHGNGVFPCGKR
jgi:hypothetical protein